MLASLSSVSEQLVQQLGYLGLVLIMAVEHIFPPIPSELVLPLAGFEVRVATSASSGRSPRRRPARSLAPASFT